MKPRIGAVLCMAIATLGGCAQPSSSASPSDEPAASEPLGPRRRRRRHRVEGCRIDRPRRRLAHLCGRRARAAYEDANLGIDLTFSFDASSALRGQVEAGAAADLFLSADARNPQTLEDAGLTTGEQVPFASNLLTIVVPSDNPGGVETWQDLATAGLRTVAAGEDVPIQQYADEAVANLGTRPMPPRASRMLSPRTSCRARTTCVPCSRGSSSVRVTPPSST